MADCTITCRKNGPYRVEGDFVLKDAEGNVFDLSGRKTISLCRCGQTQDAPFCDGTHKICGFNSEVKARTLPAPLPKLES